MFEQYRKIREQMVASLEDQNRSIDQQTTADAAASGYVRQGDVFVKPGKDGAFFTAINAYTYFDVQGNMSQELSRAGFAEMSSDAMQNFLSSKSEVEMDSYFSMQKTALQVAMENITGHGSQTERKKSQDTYVIGTFNKWAGSAGDSNDQFVASHVFANDQLLGLGFNSFLTGGFGELGSGSTRPGGAPFGFYVQLALSGYSFNQEGSRRDALAMANVDMSNYLGNSAAGGAGFGILTNAGAVSSAFMSGNPVAMSAALSSMGTAMAAGAASTAAVAGFTSLAPIATIINQFDPVAMLANSRYNVQYGHRELGKSEGYMWEANEIASIKQPLITYGQLLLASGNPIGMAVGSVLLLLGNSLNANPTTGERFMKLSEKGMVDSAISIGAAFATMGAASHFNTAVQAGSLVAESAQTLKLVAGVSMSIAASTVASGIQADEHGNLSGFDLGGVAGDTALVNAAIAALVAGAGTRMNVQTPDAFTNGMMTGVAKGAFGMVLGTLAAYGEKQAWGAEHSGFDHMLDGGFGGLLSLGVSGYMGGEMALEAAGKSVLNDPKKSVDFASNLSNKQLGSMYGMTEQEVADLRNSFWDAMADQGSRDAESGGQRNLAREIMLAASMEDDRRRQEAKGPEMSSKDVVTLAFAALKLQGKVTSPEQWNKMLDMIDPNHTQGDYSKMNLSDAMDLIQKMGGSLSEIDPTALNKEFQNQNSYGAMMDQVRMQQAIERMQQQQSVPVSQNGFPEMLDNFFNRPEFSIVGGLEASEGNSTTPRGPGFFSRLWSAMKANPVAALGVIFGGPGGAVLGTNYLAWEAMSGGEGSQQPVGTAPTNSAQSFPEYMTVNQEIYDGAKNLSSQFTPGSNSQYSAVRTYLYANAVTAYANYLEQTGDAQTAKGLTLAFLARTAKDTMPVGYRLGSYNNFASAESDQSTYYNPKQGVTVYNSAPQLDCSGFVSLMMDILGISDKANNNFHGGMNFGGQPPTDNGVQNIISNTQVLEKVTGGARVGDVMTDYFGDKYQHVLVVTGVDGNGSPTEFTHSSITNFNGSGPFPNDFTGSQTNAYWHKPGATWTLWRLK